MQFILELEWAWKITVEPSSSFYDEFRASRAELEPSLSTVAHAVKLKTGLCTPGQVVAMSRWSNFCKF